MYTKKQSAPGDRQLLVYMGILAIFGLVVLMSASAPLGYAKFHDSYFFIKRQILYGLLPGIVLLLITSKINYEWWKKLSWIVYGVIAVFLVLVFINGIGIELNGSRSWLSVGSVSFQPGELAKIAVIIVLAALLTNEKRDWTNWQTSLLPVLAIIAPIPLLIVLQPDVGTLSIIGCTIFFMLYTARVPGVYMTILGLAALLAFIVLVLVAPYRMNRLTTFLHPELDPKGIGYQINQAFLAVGSGGVFGLGLNQSRQKFQYLPEVHADSIFAIMAEELGFVVSLGFIALILVIGWRGLKIAAGAPDQFSELLVTGIVVWFVWQSFLNIGAMVGALPLTGVPLPLVSHGGSAYMAILAAFGIVMNVSKFSTYS